MALFSSNCRVRRQPLHAAASSCRIYVCAATATPLLMKPRREIFNMGFAIERLDTTAAHGKSHVRLFGRQKAQKTSLCALQSFLNRESKRSLGGQKMYIVVVWLAMRALCSLTSLPRRQMLDENAMLARALKLLDLYHELSFLTRTRERRGRGYICYEHWSCSVKYVTGSGRRQSRLSRAASLSFLLSYTLPLVRCIQRCVSSPM